MEVVGDFEVSSCCLRKASMKGTRVRIAVNSR